MARSASHGLPPASSRHQRPPSHAVSCRDREARRACRRIESACPATCMVPPWPARWQTGSTCCPARWQPRPASPASESPPEDTRPDSRRWRRRRETAAPPADRRWVACASAACRRVDRCRDRSRRLPRGSESSCRWRRNQASPRRPARCRPPPPHGPRPATSRRSPRCRAPPGPRPSPAYPDCRAPRSAGSRRGPTPRRRAPDW